MNETKFTKPFLTAEEQIDKANKRVKAMAIGTVLPIIKAMHGEEHEILTQYYIIQELERLATLWGE